MASTAPQIQGDISQFIVTNVLAETELIDIYLASLTVLVYDYILMFRHEVQFIWQSDWRLGNFLYLAIRYLGIISNVLATVGNFNHDLSVQTCSAIEITANWMLLVVIGIAQLIIYIRTYVIWGRPRKLKFALATLFPLVFAGGCVGYKFTSLTYFTTNLRMVPACIGDGQSTGIAISYGLVCFSELIIVVLTVWRCIRYEFKDMSTLLFVLYRDGIIFFLCLFVISVFNVVAVELWRDLSMLQCVMHSVLTSRVILHLHIAAAGDGASAGTVSLPSFAAMSRPTNDNMTFLTTSLESMSVPPPSANFDTGIKNPEQGGSVDRDHYVAEAY